MDHVLTPAIGRALAGGLPLHGADLRAWRALQPTTHQNGHVTKPGWTQAAAARWYGCALDTWKSWESGRRHITVAVCRRLLAECRPCPHCGKAP